MVAATSRDLDIKTAAEAAPFNPKATQLNAKAGRAKTVKVFPDIIGAKVPNAGVKVRSLIQP